MAAAKPKKPTTPWGKAWYFIWYDDSLASWLLNIVLAFIIIKFVVYPLLGFILGTSLPVVAVVSESMDHHYTKDACTHEYRLCDDNTKNKPEDYSYWDVCGEWYEDQGITEQEFSTYPFKNGFSKGDIIILRGKDAADINVGDVIVFQSGKSYPIIHRIVDKELNRGTYTFQTKGDHNERQISDAQLDETDVPENLILGTAAGKIPLLGWVKIGFVKLFTVNKAC